MLTDQVFSEAQDVSIALTPEFFYNGQMLINLPMLALLKNFRAHSTLPIRLILLVIEGYHSETTINCLRVATGIFKTNLALNLPSASSVARANAMAVLTMMNFVYWPDSLQRIYPAENRKRIYLNPVDFMLVLSAFEFNKTVPFNTKELGEVCDSFLLGF